MLTRKSETGLVAKFSVPDTIIPRPTFSTRSLAIPARLGATPKSAAPARALNNSLFSQRKKDSGLVRAWMASHIVVLAEAATPTITALRISRCLVLSNFKIAILNVSSSVV